MDAERVCIYAYTDTHTHTNTHIYVCIHTYMNMVPASPGRGGGPAGCGSPAPLGGAWGGRSRWARGRRRGRERPVVGIVCVGCVYFEVCVVVFGVSST